LLKHEISQRRRFEMTGLIQDREREEEEAALRAASSSSSSSSPLLFISLCHFDRATATEKSFF
ncbi:MAG: hypothetical protein EA361_16945, partial [Bacteroidetes bacterium]